MSTSKTLGTIIVSLVLGALTFFIATPKKLVRKKEKAVSEPIGDNNESNDRNLFI